MKKFSVLLVAIGLFIALQSCEEPTNVGESVIPDDDALAVDSILVTDFVVNTIADDTLYTSYRNNLYLGEYVSNQFGQSTAAIYTDVSQASEFETVEGPVLDSVVFYLQTPNFEGDTTVNQQFDVYRLKNRLPDDYPYLIGDGFEMEEKIGAFTDVTYSSLPTMIDSTETDPLIRGTFTESFKSDLFSKLTNGDIATTSDLQEQLKALAIVPAGDLSGKGFFSINMTSSSTNPTGIAFYYHDEEGSAYNYRINLNPFINEDESLYVMNHNQLKADYENGNEEIFMQIQQPSETGYDTGFVQAGNGVMAQLEFDGFVSDLEASVLINSAELTIYPTLENPADSTELPANLILYERFNRDDSGRKTGSLLDIAENGGEFDDAERTPDSSVGILQKDNTGNFYYRFVFPNFTELVNNGELDAKLLLGVPSSYHQTFIPKRSQSYKGMIFDARNDIELHIKYSILEN